MVNKNTNRFPGTDDNGWPDNPVQPCPQGDKLCYLAIAAIGGPPIACCYHPPDCPFWGHYPAQASQTTIRAPEATPRPGPAQTNQQKRMI